VSIISHIICSFELKKRTLLLVRTYVHTSYITESNTYYVEGIICHDDGHVCDTMRRNTRVIVIQADLDCSHSLSTFMVKLISSREARGLCQTCPPCYSLYPLWKRERSTMRVSACVLLACLYTVLPVASWTPPCSPGKGMRSCKDLCNKWKKFYPVKDNIGSCSRGCSTAAEKIIQQYTKAQPSLDIAGVKCNYWARHLSGLPSGPHITEAVIDGCNLSQRHMRACMSYNAKNFPEKFEEDEDSKVGDDEDDDDDEADTTNEKVPEKLTKGAVNAVKELPGKKKLVDAPPEDGHHRSMQDQLANFHKG